MILFKLSNNRELKLCPFTLHLFSTSTLVSLFQNEKKIYLTLNTTRSAFWPSIRLEEITQEDTGHCSLMKTPRPGLSPPQEPKPFHIKMVFKGTSESSMFSGTNPSGGTYINCSGMRSSPGASSGKTLAIRVPVSSETGQLVGLIWPSFMYQGRWSLSGMVLSWGSKMVPRK